MTTFLLLLVNINILNQEIELLESHMLDARIKYMYVFLTCKINTHRKFELNNNFKRLLKSYFLI